MVQTYASIAVSIPTHRVRWIIPVLVEPHKRRPIPFPRASHRQPMTRDWENVPVQLSRTHHRAVRYYTRGTPKPAARFGGPLEYIPRHYVYMPVSVSLGHIRFQHPKFRLEAMSSKCTFGLERVAHHHHHLCQREYTVLFIMYGGSETRCRLPMPYSTDV